MPHAVASRKNALALDNQICFALYSASLAMGRVYREVLATLGLTYPQYLVMLVLWEADEVRVSDIGERLLLDSATLTPLLKRMEKAGLIQRSRSPRDERSVLVTLTPAGSAMKETARAIPTQIGRATCLTNQQADALKESLWQLRERLLEIV